MEPRRSPALPRFTAFMPIAGLLITTLLITTLLITGCAGTPPQPPPEPAPQEVPRDSEPDYPSGELPDRDLLPDYTVVPDLELLWQLEVRDRVGATLSFDSLSETLFLGTESGVVIAVAAAGGTVRWAHDAVGEVTSAPAFDGKQVYVGFREPGGSVALEKQSGRQAWRTVAVGWVARDPVVQAGGVFFVSASELLVLRPQTGERAATYRLSIPASSSLRDLFATETGVAAGYNGAQGSGVVHVPDVRRAASTTVPLKHRADRLVPLPPASVLVHGANDSGGGDVLTSIDLGAGEVRRAVALHRDSRLLGSVDEHVLISSVPPRMLALNADTFATVWATRRYHPAVEALRGPERRVSRAGLPKGDPAPPSIAVTGRAEEGVVGYDPGTGEIRYHFAVDADLMVRGAARDDDRIFILVTNSQGGRASLMALGLGE
jgi:hypothetical protein